MKLSYGDGANAPDGSADRPITVRLSPASEDPQVHSEVALWNVIEHSTQRLSFRRYLHFMDEVLQPGIAREGAPAEPFLKRRFSVSAHIQRLWLGCLRSGARGDQRCS